MSEREFQIVLMVLGSVFAPMIVYIAYMVSKIPIVLARLSDHERRIERLEDRHIIPSGAE